MLGGSTLFFPSEWRYDHCHIQELFSKLIVWRRTTSVKEVFFRQDSTVYLLPCLSCPCAVSALRINSLAQRISVNVMDFLCSLPTVVIKGPLKRYLGIHSVWLAPLNKGTISSNYEVEKCWQKETSTLSVSPVERKKGRMPSVTYVGLPELTGAWLCSLAWENSWKVHCSPTSAARETGRLMRRLHCASRPSWRWPNAEYKRGSMGKSSDGGQLYPVSLGLWQRNNACCAVVLQFNF